MLFFAVTKPKKKIFLVAKLLFLALLIGVAVPSIYYGLSDAGAMESFMQGWLGKDKQPQEEVMADGSVREVDLYLGSADETGSQPATPASTGEEQLPGEPLRVMNGNDGEANGEAPEDSATTAAGENPMPQESTPQQPANAEQQSPENTKPAEGGGESGKQTDQPTAGDTQAPQEGGSAAPAQPEKENPGLIQRLKALIFGETPEVEIYQK